MLRKAQQLFSRGQNALFRSTNCSHSRKGLFFPPSLVQRTQLFFFSQTARSLENNKQETAEKARGNNVEEEEEEEETVKRMKGEPNAEEGGNGEKTSEEDVKRKKSVKWLEYLITLTGLGVLGYIGYEVYLLFDKETRHTSSFSAIEGWLQSLRKPSSEKLLPDVDDIPPPQRKPTLVINLDDCLVHMTYTPQTGWKIKKRPGVDRFLQELSQHYEIVIFSDQNMMTAMPIVERLDPAQLTSKLFRDATYYKDGKNVKDLSHLNRPLNRMLMLEHRQDAYYGQEANTIPMKPWFGNPQDQTLVNLIPVLTAIAKQNSFQSDIREYLKTHFNGKSAEEIIASVQQKQQEKKPQEVVQPGNNGKQQGLISGALFGGRK